MVNYISMVFHIKQVRVQACDSVNWKTQWFWEFCFRKYTSKYVWQTSFPFILPVFMVVCEKWEATGLKKETKGIVDGFNNKVIAR